MVDLMRPSDEDGMGSFRLITRYRSQCRSIVNSFAGKRRRGLYHDASSGCGRDRSAHAGVVQGVRYGILSANIDDDVRSMQTPIGGDVSPIGETQRAELPRCRWIHSTNVEYNFTAIISSTTNTAMSTAKSTA